MKEFFRSTSCGNVKVSIGDQIAHVTIKGSMNELLAIYTLSKLVEVFTLSEGKPWGLLWQSETTFAPTPKALEIMTNILDLCVEHGCVQDAIVCTSPIFMSNFKQVRAEMGSSAQLGGTHFKSVEEAKSFLLATVEEMENANK